MPNLATPVVGDVLFYKSSGSWVDEAIVRKTKGIWVHVAIVSGQGQVIEAVSGGVRAHAINWNYGAIGQVGTALRTANTVRFTAALYGLQRTLGQKYGWGDILDQVLMLLPGSPCISFDRSEDCSHLAIEFLQTAGYFFPFATEPALVSPVGLFKMLGKDVVPS